MAEVNECKVYVGNLPFSVGYKELEELFSQYGEIEEATVIADRYTGRSKGFGFVTFKNKDSAQKAISEMNDKDVQGRNLRVKEALPSKEKGGQRENKKEAKPEEKTE